MGRTTTTVTLTTGRGVFMISVAAELAEMHPQTLRMYEARGLIEPKRSPKGTRLYSQADVERLRRIQEMTNQLGLNLAGVEQVLEMEEKLERAQRRSDGPDGTLEVGQRRCSSSRAARRSGACSGTQCETPCSTSKRYGPSTCEAVACAGTGPRATSSSDQTYSVGTVTGGRGSREPDPALCARYQASPAVSAPGSCIRRR